MKDVDRLAYNCRTEAIGNGVTFILVSKQLDQIVSYFCLRCMSKINDKFIVWQYGLVMKNNPIGHVRDIIVIWC